jgi:hypothetical protein
VQSVPDPVNKQEKLLVKEAAHKSGADGVAFAKAFDRGTRQVHNRSPVALIDLCRDVE